MLIIGIIFYFQLFNYLNGRRPSFPTSRELCMASNYQPPRSRDTSSGWNFDQLPMTKVVTSTINFESFDENRV